MMTTDSQKRFKFIDLAAMSSPELTDRMVRAAEEVIRSGWFLHGRHTENFERRIAELCDVSSCVAVSNGLDAIRLIFRAYMELGRLRKGDRVLVPGNTFIASVLPLSDLGLVPVMIDPSETDYNLSLGDALEAVEADDGIKAVLLVHLYGTASWEREAAARLRSRGVLIIEDMAQAIGAEAPETGFRDSRKAGSLGDAAAISFYPTKNLGALGDGGAVLTSDDTLAETVRVLANYGSDRRYHHIMQGYNCRMDEIQAAMMLEKLPWLADVSRRRDEVARAYCGSIDSPLVTAPGIFGDRVQVWHQFVVRTPYRDELKDFLAREGVETDIHYPVPPHLQPCYMGRLLSAGSLALSERLASEVLSLPIVNTTPGDAVEIAAVINKFQI